MKSTEPSVTNGGVTKPPPYPVEKTTMIVDPPAPDPHTTDILSAVQYGYYDRVVELIEDDWSLASTVVQGNTTLLHWAAINNRVEVAEYLLNKRAQIDAFGGDLHSTPLQWAVRDGKRQMVVFLLAHQAQASSIDGEGFSAIHLASMFGHTDIVAYLVAKGQDVSLLDKDGMTPLMHAAQRIRNRDPAQLLIRLGAQVNYQNPTNQYTALHYAAAESNREAMTLLLDAGARTDICNSDNETVYEMISKRPANRYLLALLSSHRGQNPYIPKWLQFNDSIRRSGTRLLPYLLIFFMACIVQIHLPIIYKGLLIILSIFSTKGYVMVFFDKDVDRYLPISIAQASILWLYVCYFYYFLQYIHVISWTFLALVICTYLSWSNYYLARKRDPGVIVGDRDQQYRNIIQLIEQNLFDYETFCTCCLIKRPIRSKHCRECRRCIAKFDHHCPWIDNCVGEKNLRYFVGFLFFTPICLGFYLHGAYLYYWHHCHLFASESISAGVVQLFTCTPAVCLFTAIALLHTIWITCLCVTVLLQVATGYTTNEKINSWRYKYLKSTMFSPFSLGWIQNLVDLIHRRVLCYTPIHLDWTRFYSVEDFQQAVPLRIRQRLKLPSINSSMELLNV